MADDAPLPPPTLTVDPPAAERYVQRRTDSFASRIEKSTERLHAILEKIAGPRARAAAVEPKRMGRLLDDLETRINQLDEAL